MGAASAGQLLRGAFQKSKHIEDDGCFEGKPKDEGIGEGVVCRGEEGIPNVRAEEGFRTEMWMKDAEGRSFGRGMNLALCE